ncbi:hypothetical protein IAT38_001564 [Cryptococcus sp. DSM 104549]
MAPTPAAPSLTGGDTTTSPQLNVQLPRQDNWWNTAQPSTDPDIDTSYDDDGYAVPTTAAAETDATVTYHDNTDIVLPTTTSRYSEAASPAATSADPHAGYTDSSTSADWWDTTSAVDGGYGSETQVSTTAKKSKTTRLSSTSTGYGDALNATGISSDSSISTKTSASKAVKTGQVTQSTASSPYASASISSLMTTDGTGLLPVVTPSTTSSGVYPSTAYQASTTHKSFFDDKGKVAGMFATVGIVLLAILMGLLVFCFRRRKSNERRNKGANKGLLADHEKGHGSAGSSGTGLNEVQPSIQRVEARQSIPPIPPFLPFQYYATQPTIERTLAPANNDFANRISNDSAYSQEGEYQPDLERGNITPPEIGRTGRRWTPADRINWGAAAHSRRASKEQAAAAVGAVNGGNSEQTGLQSIEHATAATDSFNDNHNDLIRASPSRNSIGSAASRGSVVYSRTASGPTTPITGTPLTPPPTDWASRLRQGRANSNSVRSATSNSSFKVLVPPSRSPRNGAGSDNGYVIRQLPTEQELEENMQPSRRTDMGSPKVQDPVREEGKRYSMGGRTALESWENLQKFQESRRMRESVLRE